MEQMQEKINKLREDRLAREKARIEKLRELNLKKYTHSDPPRNSVSNISLANKQVKSDFTIKNLHTNTLKNNFHVNGTTKRPVTVPQPKSNQLNNSKPKLPLFSKKTETKTNNVNLAKNRNENIKPTSNIDKKPTYMTTSRKSIFNNTLQPTKSSKPTEKQMTTSQPLKTDRKPSQGETTNFINKNKRISMATNLNARKSLAVKEVKSNIPQKSQAPSNISKSESVFDRLYKPKAVHKTQINEAEKLRTDPNYLQKVIRTTGLILNKRHTVFEPAKAKIALPVRRSISAVHFKRISKTELPNCIQKWSSIGDNLNKEHLKDIQEDDAVKDSRIISAVKSERKKVTFLTPIRHLNTPRPEELQARLKSWLQKRGKSLDSYHHLQCFGIHHLPRPLKFDTKMFEEHDEENKENIAVENDSDNESYTENMNEEDRAPVDKWRRVSSVSDSLVDINESQNTTLTCSEVDNTDVLVGALNDLTELLKEGFDWEQCARWLRAIRERFPSAPTSAAYWECRAALEESRGNLPASVQCWEEAIVKGTEHSVVEANLDQLLDKFMQLKISPNSGKRRSVDPKLVDVKNVFKSTIIRFAVQQAKLRQSGQFDAPKYTVTPVRRSARLSAHWSAKRTPLQVCTSVRQADELLGQKPLFIPNESLYGTP